MLKHLERTKEIEEISMDQVKRGDIVYYHRLGIDKAEGQHSGICTGRSGSTIYVASKWGVGAIYQHGLSQTLYTSTAPKPGGKFIGTFYRIK